METVLDRKTERAERHNYKNKSYRVLMLDSFVYSQLDKRQNEQNVQNDRILFFMRQSFVFLLEISNSSQSLCV